MELKQGYKKTDVGVIPDDWKVASLNQVTKDMLQGVNTAIDIPEYVRYGKPMLKANDVIDGDIDFNDVDYISEKTYNRYSNRFKAKKGDFLFSNIGARLGTGALLKKDVQCSFAWNVMRIIPNQEKIHPEFLSCSINSPNFYKSIISHQTGSGMGFVPKNILKNIQIPLPSTIKEQKAIAQVLSDTDSLIQAIAQKLTKKRAIKQGAMQQLLTPKEDWEVKKLGEIARYRRGSFPQPYGLPQWYDENNGTPFVQVYDVDKNMRLKSTTKQKISELAKDKSVFVEKGNVVITLQGSIGRIAITQYDAYVDRTLLIFTDYKVPMDKVFFAFAIQEKFRIEKENAPGGIIKTITKEELSKFDIPLPKTKDEQTEIANILSDMDAEIEQLEQKLSKYKMVKQGLMQNLLTGKIRLV